MSGGERAVTLQGEKRRRDSSVGSASSAAPASFAVVCRREMYDSFQTWALKTYGDSAKTKTVTRKKYNRIGKILKGEEQNNAENSKFRFWVKAKGFRMGPPPGQPSDGKRGENVLYVPCAPVKPTPDVKEEIVFKKVAVVENFFDIIYNVHVEMDGRGGKHAGQKRTYKAIAESYAFLPREAVTKFLMQCSDCQKRMHAGPDATNGATSPADSCRTTDSIGSDPPEIDYSLPITTTYLKHLRNLGYSEEEVLNMDHEDSLSNEETGSSGEGSPHPADEEMSPYSGKEDDEKSGVVATASSKYSPVSSPLLAAHLASEHTYDRPLDMTKGDSNSDPSSSTSASAWPATSLPLNMNHNGDASSRLGRHHSHHSSNSLLPPPPPGPLSHRHSHPHHAHHHSHHGHGHHLDSRGLHDHTYEDIVNGSCHDRTVTPEDLSGCVKEEDDEEDDEVDEKLDTQKCDPERLKAFNMFVRLFVDENLDRMVPISKQPKEKIQAIIDSCSRQFPEFSERSRKRIRTYLKSCRRTKRCRDQNGWDPGRPTPPHLTSAMAEQILAAACDNESNNAKRMRLGLDPISVCVLNDRENNDRLEPPIRQPSNIRAFTSDFHRNGISSNGAVSYRMTSTASPAMPNGSASPSHCPALSSKVQSNSSSAASSPKYQASSTECPTSTGPADLTIKKESNSPVVNSATSSLPLPTGSQPPQPPAKCPLNPSEVSAVRQLIAGYRESAAFLVRSADELEQLLLQQN